MPNGEQEQDPEGEASGGESGEWYSDGGEDDESDDSDDGEEADDSETGEVDFSVKTYFEKIIVTE